ncbi:MAG: hypothetical protein HUJ86_04130, partial [Synergistes sp.]|nr:hypothetical protein [Synergistes sp.]
EAAAPYVSYMTFDTLNMRPQNKDALLSFVAALRSELKGLYEDIYIRGDKSFFRILREEIREACRRYGVKGTIYF